jgi:kynurenine 3-monooxygenase
MNCGMEDCLVLNSMLEKHEGQLGPALEEYSQHRNPDAEAMCDLAMYNYIEVRPYVVNE